MVGAAWQPGLRAWQEQFEVTAIGDKVTMGLSEKFELELGNVLL